MKSGKYNQIGNQKEEKKLGSSITYPKQLKEQQQIANSKNQYNSNQMKVNSSSSSSSQYSQYNQKNSLMGRKPQLPSVKKSEIQKKVVIPFNPNVQFYQNYITPFQINIEDLLKQ